MSLFRYRAIAANGDAVQGEMEAASQGAAVEGESRQTAERRPQQLTRITADAIDSRR